MLLYLTHTTGILVTELALLEGGGATRSTSTAFPA